VSDHVNDQPGEADQAGDDLRDLLDSSFGDGPPPAPAAERLVPARAALRRRRWAQAGGVVVATAAAVTAVAALSGGGGTTTREIGPAGPGQETSAAPTRTSVDDCDALLGDDVPPSFEGGAEPLPLDEQYLQVDPKAGPATDAPASGDWSMTWEDCAVSTEPPAPALEVEPSPSDTAPLPGESDLVRFADAGTETLVARDGVALLDQSGDVALPERFAAADDRTAVAQVSVDGQVVYVLARQLDGGREEYIATVDRRGRWATITDFLAFAATKYTPAAGGGSEGLR
jgi:hypothetical protein